MAAAQPGAQPAWVPKGPRRCAGGYFIPPGARLAGLRGRDGASTLTVGDGASCGVIDMAGAVELRPRSACASVRAGLGVTLAAGAVVHGDAISGGRVVVMAGARVGGRIEAGGDVLLLGGCEVGDVKAGGDILVAGTPRTGRLEPAGRVTARQW